MKTAKPSHRVLSGIVWLSRAVGWLLVAIAIVNAIQAAGVSGKAHTLGLLSSGALGLAAIVGLTGLELFLRFFDRFLSRN